MAYQSVNPYDGTTLKTLDTIDRLPQSGARALQLKKHLQERLIEHRRYINTFSQDMPEIRHWQWGATETHASAADGR